MNKDFYKVYGAKNRQDQIVKLSETNYLLIIGFGKDGDNGYNYRKNYDHKPSIEELRTDIEILINKETDAVILNGFVWNGKSVYLSTENQINFKAAYDLAVQTEGATLPIKFKLGEDADGNPVYHTFQKLEAFTDFFTKAFAFISKCLNEGWSEKDSIDYAKLLENE
jgi:hypothetical protein